jgi:hypothetical protein
MVGLVRRWLRDTRLGRGLRVLRAQVRMALLRMRPAHRAHDRRQRARLAAFERGLPR